MPLKIVLHRVYIVVIWSHRFFAGLQLLMRRSAHPEVPVDRYTKPYIVPTVILLVRPLLFREVGSRRAARQKKPVVVLQARPPSEGSPGCVYYFAFYASFFRIIRGTPVVQMMGQSLHRRGGSEGGSILKVELHGGSRCSETESSFRLRHSPPGFYKVSDSW